MEYKHLQCDTSLRDYKSLYSLRSDCKSDRTNACVQTQNVDAFAVQRSRYLQETYTMKTGKRPHTSERNHYNHCMFFQPASFWTFWIIANAKLFTNKIWRPPPLRFVCSKRSIYALLGTKIQLFNSKFKINKFKNDVRGDIFAKRKRVKCIRLLIFSRNMGWEPGKNLLHQNWGKRGTECASSFIRTWTCCHKSTFLLPTPHVSYGENSSPILP